MEWIREIPYWLILLVLVGRLAARHRHSLTASDLSKRTVLGCTVGAVLLVLLGRAVIPAVLLLAAVGVYIVLHRIVTPVLEPETLGTQNDVPKCS
ncbi:unnamed protein product [Gemmata massiliana]|uniref:Uncharacterized protein n=1 Tax=Gemmata massiliana TaxID=1210884 RepID=A0A6P2CZI2_9BACT|nr:unnamed protein product [Gemmata massiliana]